MSQKKKHAGCTGCTGLSAFQHFVVLALELCHRTVAWMYFLPCFSCYFFVAGLFRRFFFSSSGQTIDNADWGVVKN